MNRPPDTARRCLLAANIPGISSNPVSAYVNLRTILKPEPRGLRIALVGYRVA